jgi:hypothetical protein
MLDLFSARNRVPEYWRANLERIKRAARNNASNNAT